MLPAEGQMSKEGDIYRRRTYNVVSNVHYRRDTYQEGEAAFRETQLQGFFAIRRLVEPFQVSSTALLHACFWKSFYCSLYLLL